MKPAIKFAAFVLIAGFVFGSCKKEKNMLQQQPPNNWPVAIAGANQVIEGQSDSAILDGTASYDPDGTITSFKWTKISGSDTFLIVDPSSAKTTVKHLVKSVYEFQLIVTDNVGQLQTDTVKIYYNVLPPLPGPAPPPSPSNCDIISAQLVPFGTLSQARYINIAVTAGNKILFQGGNSSNTGAGTRVDIYDIATKTWSTAELSLSRQYMTVSALGNRVFFAGGTHVDGDNYDNYVFTESSRVDIYFASADAWSTAELSAPREHLVSSSAGNKILFAGGVASDPYPISSDKVDIYDGSSNSWSTAALSEARGSLSAATAGDKIYFAGGISGTGSDQPQFSKRIDIYNVTNNSWSTSSLTCEGKAQLTSIAVGNKILWAGGSTSFTPTFSDNVEIRDLTTQTSSCTQLCYTGVWHIDGNAVLRENKIVFYNRYEGNFEGYDLYTDKSFILNLNNQIVGAGIISVNNKIYLAGGSVNGTPSNQVWLLEF